MKIEDILKYLSDRNIQATEAQVKSLGVDLDDITPQSIEVIAQQLQSQSTAIAPATPSTAITPKRNRRKKDALAPVNAPVVSTTQDAESAGQSAAGKIETRFDNELDPLVNQFDQIRLDRQREAAAYMLQATANLQADTLQLVAKGLEVMPVGNQFRFFSDANDVGASA